MKRSGSILLLCFLSLGALLIFGSARKASAQGSGQCAAPPLSTTSQGFPAGSTVNFYISPSGLTSAEITAIASYITTNFDNIGGSGITYSQIFTAPSSSTVNGWIITTNNPDQFPITGANTSGGLCPKPVSTSAAGTCLAPSTDCTIGNAAGAAVTMINLNAANYQGAGGAPFQKF